MRERVLKHLALVLLLSSIIAFVIPAQNAFAGGKLGIYGIRMVPDGSDAEKYSRAGWGGGVHVVAPIAKVWNLFAGVAGAEVVDLMSEKIVFTDSHTGLRVEHQTDELYGRFYLGGQIGSHSAGFIRPHAGMNLALVIYGINTDVVIPNDADPDNEIRQDLYSKTEAVFGYDITLGLDLNFSNRVSLDGGVRYLKSFAVPQDLGGTSEKVYPQYFQVYLGIGVSFNLLNKWGNDADSHENEGD